MNINLKKYIVIGPVSAKDAFFSQIQKAGIVEFIKKKAHLEKASSEVQTFIDALHILRRMTPASAAPPDELYLSSIVLARRIVERNAELEQLRERARIAEKEIDRIKIFGDFSLEQLHELEKQAHRKIQFYFTKEGRSLEATQREEVIYVGSLHGLDYYMAINPEARSYEGLTEMIIDRSLGDLQVDQANIRRGIDEAESELGALTHFKKVVKQGLINELNHYHLESSKEHVSGVLDGEVFAIEGWVPENKVKELESVAEKNAMYVAPISVEDHDRVPTHLENRGVGRIGEDLVHIYDTPSNKDKDPSNWVFFSFALFFSMIIGDAGYGVLLLIISLYLLFKFGKKRGLGRRIILLSTYLSIGCIIWGVISASYFGIPIPPDSSMRKVSFVDWMVRKKVEYLIDHKDNPVYKDAVKDYPSLAKVTDPQTFLMQASKKQGDQTTYPLYEDFTDNVMLELVLFIGTIHVILSFVRYLGRNWAGIGWILFMIGGYLYFPSILQAISLIHYVFGIPAEAGAQVGLYLLFIGLGLATVLAVIEKKLEGLAEPMLVIQVFADVMSYLRIYALALAGMIMASTFDHMGLSVPLYFGILIILAGHTINFTLALMGGLIHGLRLNFIEWYHYSFEGGGKRFNPLKISELE